jgi:hypothetical protein
MGSRGLKEVTRLRNVCGGCLIRRANDPKFQRSNMNVFRRPGDKYMYLLDFSLLKYLFQSEVFRMVLTRLLIG